MEVEGQIESIIYQNEINSYTVCTVELEEGHITAVGYMPFISAGDRVKLVGQVVNHKDYGEQLKVATFEKLLPTTGGAILKYLSSGSIKGIGPATAKKIVDKFGEETIHILKFEPEKLAEIKGINIEKANSIGEMFLSQWEMWQIVLFLEKFNIEAKNAKKVYDKLGLDAIARIEENPYILVNVIYGLDFKAIDKTALKMGIEIEDSSRVSSGITYSMLIAIQNGHTCVLKENLISFVGQLLHVEREYIENQIVKLLIENEIVEQIIEGESWIFLQPFYKAEKNISEKIKALANENKKLKEEKDTLKKIKLAEDSQDIELSPEQKDAVSKVMNNNISVITGGPGTGKTTVIKTILEIFDKDKKKVVLCAPTGRAAKRMTEATGCEASTIHRLLELRKNK